MGAGCPITAYFVSTVHTGMPSPPIDTSRFKNGEAVKVSSNDTWEFELNIPGGSLVGKPNEEYTFFIIGTIDA